MPPLSQEALEAMIERAAKKGAREALESIGLHDEKAVRDMNELRGLLEAWRETKKTAWRTITKTFTMIFLGIIAAGTWTYIRNNGQ